MLVNAQANRRNLRWAAGLACATAIVTIALSLVSPWWLLGLPLAWVVFRFIRRKTVRRLAATARPFPAEWEATLTQRVDYYRALDDDQKQRFRSFVQVFLEEVQITGIRTDVDDVTRVLVAASAIIPVFGFEDWEYSGLGEVLIYPNAFGSDYRTDELADRDTLGMVGDYHLSGVMILSKPDLIAGFANAKDRRNVGIHEFAHLVDKANGSVDGIPAEIPAATVRPWIEWVAHELKSTSAGNQDIDDYAYTNEAEYFAVLSEYFFEKPDVLDKRHPELYRMLQAIYHQNTKKILSGVRHRPRRYGRNDPCPCGSGEKYKHCCRAADSRKRARPSPAPSP